MSATTGVGARHVCSGSLIDRSTVLTSAHCLHDVTVDEMVVIVGADNYMSAAKEQMHKVTSFAHPGFEYRAFAVRNDIALLFLETCVSQEMSFPTLAVGEDDDLTCLPASTVGFGKSEQVPADLFIPDGQLRSLVAPQRFHSHPICREAFVSFVLKTRFMSTTVAQSTHQLISSSIDSTIGCYGGSAEDRAHGFPCEGDSGGPVFSSTTGRLVGVTSFSSQNCGTLPNYYSRVSKYSAWIESQRTKHVHSCTTGRGRTHDHTLASKSGASSGIPHLLSQLNSTTEERCPFAFHLLENLVASSTTPSGVLREACSGFLTCIDEHNPVRSVDIVNELLSVITASLRESTIVPAEFRRLASRLLLCNSEFEMYYDDIRDEADVTLDFMSKSPAKDECKLITS